MKTRMKKGWLCAALLLWSAVSAGQAKRPTVMVVPSDAWCGQNQYVSYYDNQGVTEMIPNYKAALQSNTDLLLAISKINTLMAARNFPLKDLESTLKSIERQTAEDNMMTSKTSGASTAESPIDRLRRTAKADIILQLTWTVNTVGPKHSITYNLQALDSYTNKQVAGAQGTGQPSFSAEIPVLLEEAVQVHMDNFCTQLQNHFDDLYANGREVNLDIKLWDNSDIDLETEFDGMELTEIIDDWVAANTMNHMYNKSDASENFIQFEQVRIPMYRENGNPMDAEHFARNLRQFLRKTYGLQSKVLSRGLGRGVLIIGEK